MIFLRFNKNLSALLPGVNVSETMETHSISALQMNIIKYLFINAIHVQLNDKRAIINVRVTINLIINSIALMCDQYVNQYARVVGKLTFTNKKNHS